MMLNPPFTRRVILIRHAESEENVAEVRALKVVKRLFLFKLPKLEDVIFAFHFVISQLFHNDPPLSCLGRRQISSIAVYLAENKYLQCFNPNIIICSTLLRARATYLGIFPDNNIIPCIYRNDLKEASWIEGVYNRLMRTRIQNFEKFIRDSNYGRIVIIGHSQYFKSMTTSQEYMRNCDVWEVDYVYDELNKKYIWENLHARYRTELSLPHPLNRFFDSNFHEDEVYDNRSPIDVQMRQHHVSTYTMPSSALRSLHDDNNNDNNNNDDDDDDDDDHAPTCRICQMKQVETPHLLLIRPCKCSGSLAYVHKTCLNEWRATSPTAQSICSICNYTYKIKKLPIQFIAIITHPTTIFTISCTGIYVSLFLIGIPIKILLMRVRPHYNPGNTIAEIFNLSRIWNTCQRAHRHKHSSTLIIKTVHQWCRVCNTPAMTFTLDALLCGYLIVSTISFIFIITREMRRRFVQPEANDLRRAFDLVVTFIGLCSSTDIR
jgi:phosphohistidine phosphatase SixA